MREISFLEENMSIIHLMKKLPKFDLLADSELREFYKAGRFREYAPGEVLIQEGDYDCWVYFLIAGELELSKGGKRVGYLKRNGDMFGEMGVIDGSPRSATIRALSKCIVMGIDASLIDQSLKANKTSFCYVIYRLFAEVLAMRLRDTTQENVALREALARFGGEPTAVEL